MSNLTSDSTGTSTGRCMKRVVGVPTRCWCGQDIVTKFSKTEWNPNRRYYRCAYAAAKKLSNDDHVFKWVDESLHDEILTIAATTIKMEEEFVRKEEAIEKAFQNMEAQIFEKVENALQEAKSGLKRLFLIVILGCMFIVGCIKLL